MSVTFLRGASRLANLVLLGALVSCSGELPNTAFSDLQGERDYTALSAATPIVNLIHDRDIRIPDESSPVPLLEQVRREVAKSDPNGTYAGITYDLSGGNSLPKGWVVQSPTRWGHRADDLPLYPLDCKNCERDVLLPTCNDNTDCPNGGVCRTIWAATAGAGSAKRKVCFGHSDALLLPVHDLVASARRSVDIAALQPMPDMRFLAALRSGLNELAASRRPVTVRLIIGQYPPDGVDAAALLSSLTSELRDVRGARLTVSVAAMRSCTAFEYCKSFSWPHAKFIAVDGREALVGGHNLWSEDYLVDSPVHDLSMLVRGPAAASPSRFADRLWQFVCANLDRKPSVQLANFASGQNKAPGACPASLAPPVAARLAGGGLPILAVGRLGAGITSDFANQSELARDLVFGAARHTIRVSQQDIDFTLGRTDAIFPESTLERIIDFIEQRDGQVYIVLSSPGSTGNSGSTYSNDVTLSAFARHLRDMVQKRVDASDPKERYTIRNGPDPINALLCSHVHLAPLRFGPDATWPGGRAIANHAKLWMVDDRVFYIGSDNLYPVNLQEFGYIVDDQKAAAELIDAYWNPLWQWSQRAAVSGDGVERCIFRTLLR
jgi:phosphatidylserine/phosphatidylglycerophosphate/cardiolipin synthase-like enzyme